MKPIQTLAAGVTLLVAVTGVTQAGPLEDMLQLQTRQYQWEQNNAMINRQRQGGGYTGGANQALMNYFQSGGLSGALERSQAYDAQIENTQLQNELLRERIRQLRGGR